MTTYFEYYAGRRGQFVSRPSDTVDFPDITVTEADLTAVELAQIEKLKAEMKRSRDDYELQESLKSAEQDAVLWPDTWLERT